MFTVKSDDDNKFHKSVRHALEEMNAIHLDLVLVCRFTCTRRLLVLLLSP